MRNHCHWVFETPEANPKQAAITIRRRQETTLTIKPIVSRLGFGPSKSASPRRRERQNHPLGRNPPNPFIGRVNRTLLRNGLV